MALIQRKHRVALLATGKLHSFWKADLREFRKDLAKSPMPSYRELLTPGEVDDVVTYLASLQETK